MKAEEIKKKLDSAILCLMAHPDNETDSEFADRIDDLIDIRDNFSLSKTPKKEEEKLNNDTSNPELINTECKHQHTGINWAGQIECSDCKKVF